MSIFNVLRKLLYHQPQHIIKEDAELEQFFTDAIHARQVFESLVDTKPSPKHLIVIHGIGAVGKSSLLKMYRLHCKKLGIPVALVSVEDNKSEYSILSNWVDDLKKDGVELKNFIRTREHYRATIAKVDAEKLKSQEKRGKATEIVGKVAIKATETTAGAVFGTAAGSIVPGIGTVAGALGGAIIGTSAEELKEFYQSFLPKSDIELLFDPATKLTNDFLSDIEQATLKSRIVLMLDTFEQMKTLSIWLCGVVKHLPENVLFVNSGRTIPEWDRIWSGWIGRAEIIEIKEMKPEDLRELVYRYYAYVRGGKPDPQQVEAIVQFARGLPMVATTAIQLWVKYPRGDEDFKAVKLQVLADLVDRLLEGVPIERRSAFEVAAVLRYFNADILGAVLEGNDMDELYTELRRWPFIRSLHENYLALHDIMREMINKAVYMRTPERFRALHERAAAYYEEQMNKYTGEEAERIGLEQLYHRISANEEIGIRLFQEMAEELVRYRLVNHLRVLLNDVNNYSLEKENNQLWRDYYNARLAHLEARLADAENIYQEIEKSETVETKLRAYVLCDYGDILVRYDLLGETGGPEKAIRTLEQSIRLGSELDSHLNNSFFSLSRVARYQGRWDKEIEYLKKSKNFFEQRGDNYGLVHVYSEMKRANARRGIWKDFFIAHEHGFTILSQISTKPIALRTMLLGAWVWVWALVGRFADCEQNARESLALARDIQDDISTLRILRDLGWALSVQRKFTEADKCFSENLSIVRRFGKSQLIEEGSVLGFWGASLIWRGQLDKAIDYLTQSLSIKESLHDTPGIIEPLNWLGLALEIQGNFDKALGNYQQCLEWKWYGRCYFDCGALTGIVRIKHAIHDYIDFMPLLIEAEQLAQQYEYNDHLASLRLTQGHIAWDGYIPGLGNGFNSALHYYKHALIYALRYNRFLFDEVLLGRPNCTALRPIIPHCLERGEEGKKMLRALRDWWIIDTNDVDVLRHDTISPIPENILLKEAERIARKREPGDGSPQSTVVEQIEKALQNS